MTLNMILETLSNDYSHLESIFWKKSGRKLVEEQSGSTVTNLSDVGLLPGVSVIIPAYNSIETLIYTLESLNQQTFFSRDSTVFEVVVVDDGSNDNTYEQVVKESRAFGYSLKIICLSENMGLSAARNIGFLNSMYEILLFLDADVIASQHLVAAHAIRHSFCDNIFLASFRESIEQLDDRISRDLMRNKPELIKPSFKGDWRYKWIVKNGQFKWLETDSDSEFTELNSLKDTNNWKELGFGKKYYGLSLVNHVVGVCFSINRNIYGAVGGCWQGFKGWGPEDQFLGAMLIASGVFIVPCFESVYHIEHAPRAGSELEKVVESRRNRKLFGQLLSREYEDLIKQGRIELASLKNIAVTKSYNNL